MTVSDEKTTIISNARRGPATRLILRFALGSTLFAAVLILSLLRWGGYLLISDDPLPLHVDGAVVLQGSVLGENARIAGAVRLLERGTTPRLLLSIPRKSYWGQPVAPLAFAYFEKTYGEEAASHIAFCQTDDVDSTEEEARALVDCIDREQLRSVAIVTSDYHTRRAGIIWRKILRQQESSVHLWIHAVPDPEFDASGWWRERRSAKTWLLESTKLVWTLAGR
ncbi:MAG: YdcF family protein [Candidatus Sulfotelmatobacter sp.]